MDEREDSRALELPYLNFALTPEQERLIERWSVVNAGPNKAITPSMRHSSIPSFYFPASISFIAWRANEKSRTSSRGRFFSPTRAMIASTSASVMVPSRERVLSSLS